MKVYLLTITDWRESDDTVRNYVYTETTLSAAAKHFCIEELNAENAFSTTYESSDDYEADPILSIRDIRKKLSASEAVSWCIMEQGAYYSSSTTISLQRMEVFKECQGKEEF